MGVLLFCLFLREGQAQFCSSSDIQFCIEALKMYGRPESDTDLCSICKLSTVRTQEIYLGTDITWDGDSIVEVFVFFLFYLFIFFLPSCFHHCSYSQKLEK